MEIKVVSEVTDRLILALEKLMSLLTGRDETITKEAIEAIISSPHSYLFVAVDDEDNILGSLTLIIYTIPTRKKAYIEDVVVDGVAQGLGLGEKLLTAAINKAKEEGVACVELTSRPFRIPANRLYQKMGFKIRETNCYQLVLLE